jgi:type I restriction enzyme S subunit
VSDVQKIPSSWLEILLSEVIQTQKGKKPKDLGDFTESRNIPYINIKAFEKKIITEYAPEQNAVECNDDDILLVWDGARAGLHFARFLTK